MTSTPASRLLHIAMLTAMPALLTAGLSSCDSNNVSAATPGQDDRNAVLNRDDVKNLPGPLKTMLGELGARPHSSPPNIVFAEAATASQLFQYYLLTTANFQPNVFTTTISGINDGVAPSATGANGNQSTFGTVRVVLEPKPNLPADPNDPGAFLDIFTDISGLFVINNESGWYEGWMIHDMVVPAVAAPRADGHAQFGTLLQADANALAAMGAGNNVPGHVFTLDGNAVRLPAVTDVFPDNVGNTVPIQLSMGAFNCQQQSDCHAYWEFNQYTDWVAPPYELPFTGGIKGDFAAGQIGARQSIVPGSGPSGISNTPLSKGDNPALPRDPDRAFNSDPSDPDRGTVNNDDHKETRIRFIESGLANEIFLDVYARPASFEPGVTNIKQRIFDAQAAEVARIDTNNDGVVTFVEGDLEDESDGGQSNDRLFIPVTQFNRFAVTREINDGLLSPRFAPSQRAWLLSGSITAVSPAVAASMPQDADNR